MRGWLDATAEPIAWSDETAQSRGWFDQDMLTPPAEEPPPSGTPPLRTLMGFGR